MIYEAAVVAHSDLSDEKLEAIRSMVSDVLAQTGGEMILNEDWGSRTFGQATESGRKKGHYLYFMYKSNGTANKELSRRLGINEEVLKSMIINVGEDRFQEKYVSEHRSPFAKQQA